jgi:hypothetical protein
MMRLGQTSLSAKITVAVCAALLVAFYAIGWRAVRGKSPTMDEPLHATGAYLHTFKQDYRVNSEDPPLWKRWAMLPHRRDEISFDVNHPDWSAALTNTDYQSVIATRTLFQTAGNDGGGFINASRRMMLLVGVALGVLVARWTWKLSALGAAHAGQHTGASTAAVATITAALLFCLDPNFLAHAPLLKNDVAITFLMLAVATVTWSVGRRIDWWNVPLLGVTLGAALSTKFSGALLVPMLVLMLFMRVALPEPWCVLRREHRTTAAKLATSLVVIVVCCFLAWATVWVSYGLRFDPTPQSGALLPIENQVRRTAANEFFLRYGTSATDEQVEQWPASFVVRGVLWAQQRRLMPQAWLYGFLMTYQSTLTRPAYVLGETRLTGWWYYFPLAMLFKTPLATIVAALLAAAIGIHLYLKRRAKPQAAGGGWWDWVCLVVPVVVYGTSAMSSNLNLGVRHILPIYPFLYVMVGLAAARAATTRPFAFRVASAVLVVGLLLETLVAFPHFIPFFNALWRPYRLHLLSDSNIDWGQDLTLLAEWRRKNLETTLYMAYFGSADPAFYGITDYINLPGGFWMNRNFQWLDPARPGVVAISANVLQGNNLPPSLAAAFAPFRSQRPREVLGGSIYLFDFPPAN